MDTDLPELTVATGQPPTGLTRANAATFAAGATAIVVGLIRSKIVALLLGPFGVGAYASVVLYLSSAMVVASAAAGSGAVRALAAMRADDQSENRIWLERYMFVGPLLVGLLITATTVVFAEPLSVLLLGQADLTFALLLVCAAIPIAVIAASYTNFLQAALRIGTIARADIVTTIVSLPLTIGLVIALGLGGAVIAIGAAFIVRLTALRIFSPGVRPRGRWARSLRVPAGALQSVLVIGSAGAVLGVATTLGALLIRAEIVRALGLETNGLYQPIAALSDTYLDVLIAGSSVYLFPRLTALLRSGDRATSELELSQGLRMSLALSVPLMLVTIGFGDLVVRLLYSDAFADAAWPLAVQTAGTVLKVVAIAVGTALLPLGLTRAWVVIGVLAVVLRYAGVILLAPHAGLLGVAVASDMAWVFSAGAVLFTVQRSGRLRVSRRDMLRVAFAGALVLGVLAARATDGTLAVAATSIALIAWLYAARHQLAALFASVWGVLTARTKPSRSG